MILHFLCIAMTLFQRLKLGGDMPRWWEDIYFNDQQDEFPDDFLECNIVYNNAGFE